jgi:hypothetical protein
MIKVKLAIFTLKRKFFCFRILFTLIMIVGRGNGLPSLRSKAKFDRTYGHIGSEIPQVIINYLQSRILVNARKSELAN